MLASRTRWKVASPAVERVRQLQKELGLTSLVAKVMAARDWDVEQARQFMDVDNQTFHDPFLMDGMAEAVERIQEALLNDEKIRVYGDYDCDGITSTVIMYKTLSGLGASVDYYIPNRFSEGYGLNKAAIDKAKAEGIQLLVTVDTGISGREEIAYATQLGIDVIVTDHHQPPPELPECLAVINPKKPGCSYPFKDLSGAGLALKMAQALLDDIPLELVDIAAIGTIADLVPLVDENRLIAYHGLKVLNHTQHVGLQVLIEQAGLGDASVDEQHVGFALGPRLNSCGRLASADTAVQLFLTNDRGQATAIVQEMEKLNTERQRLVQQIVQEAKALIETDYPHSKPKALVVASEGWHEGVLGIVASKLVEHYYVPVVVLTIDAESGLAKGSARSIEGFDIYQALSTCREWLPHFGGHPMAAGLSLAAEHIPYIRTRLDQLAEQWLSEEDLQPATRIDILCTASELTLEAIEQLRRLAPFGEGNPKPVLLLEQLSIQELRQVGTDGQHLKCVFHQEDTYLETIGFGWGEIAHQISPAAKVNLIGEASINEWNGQRKPQIMMTDLEVRERQFFDWRSKKDLAELDRLLPADETVAVCCFRDSRPEGFLEQAHPISVALNGQPDQPPLLGQAGRVLLYDLPRSEEQLHRFCRYLGHVGRIYMMFHHDGSHFFSTIPTREHFKWYYAFLQHKGPFDLKAWGPRLAKQKGWTMDTLQFMTDVFLELEFATIREGKIQLIPHPRKKDLSQSTCYQLKQEELKLEQVLIYSSYQELIRYLSHHIESHQADESSQANSDMNKEEKAYGF
ncbi:single-stranded-DNA-specific exonuclease [Caldalkalibacillus uzonensis]|uniref:Single-stranded-DNA-specific exonuclease RecJ n=1 Tax=Caldalkalibacillus uzonensis TaxID=353224 RepID=A0ABU0CUF5_9BACI|nr:single-stranded-DNA-specific exonuclease RecJ [Caldalkalibacillus uzonensis]MDQ0339529.1 single-stranded-DNA-specific exonuclease [Caldalkalibacillus uzonensis]